ncbi:PIN domain-containing protein [Brumimicrobium salinarum]|uniref:PIN domain nuclease n=1 Tax=Brumimicrobium salinarum TaxID=2058658 RepID=UPI001F0BBABC|nr:PIN domain nuclease [Brumimicrobium salinarum]
MAAGNISFDGQPVQPFDFYTNVYVKVCIFDKRFKNRPPQKFKIISEICSLNEQTIEKGLNSSFADFEDALQYFNATEAECDIILTRNGKDFKKSLLPIMTPDEFIKSLI